MEFDVRDVVVVVVVVFLGLGEAWYRIHMEKVTDVRMWLES